MVWYEEDDERRLLRIPLIVESEWGKSYEDIKYDFEKLLAGNAICRLMICQWKFADIDSLLLRLKTAIEIFEENWNDRFIVAILNSGNDQEFRFYTYTKQQGGCEMQEIPNTHYHYSQA